MSKELLEKVLYRGVDGNLNSFFCDVSNNYVELEDDLPAYDDERFTDFRAIGEIVFNANEKLVVITAKVSNDLTERSGKKAQYEKAKKILKDYMKYDAGIFVFSDAAGSFRFSLVYGQAQGTKRVFSNFRRFTYFVSRDQTNKTFYDRIGKCDFSSLDIIKDAFSVEKVTKDFYKQIADWYFWAVRNSKFPDAAENEENGRNIAIIRLITRLIFIWFMKERKLVSPDLFDKTKMSALLKSLKADETTYYKAILQNLFFATLNTKIEDRKFRFTRSFQGKNTDYMDHAIYRYEDYFNNREDMLAVFKDIPFLNGGLFDCLDWSAKESGIGTEVRFDGFSDKEIGLKVPNYLFFSEEREADLNKDYGTKNRKYRVQGLLNILSAYNFTIDENDPNDQEVALDPELLGKVFENLLASFNPETATTARKATGSYYTPREIVDYMVTQSLKQYYKTHLGEIDDIDSKLEKLLSPVTDEAVSPFDDVDSKKVVQLTEALRIVDPAVGSGAFPMGILNKLVSVLSRVDPDNRLWQEAQLKAVEDVPDPLLKQKLVKQINEQFAEKNSNYGRKLYLIQKCIYGVDIQQIAIEIAKLRFFIALLVDERIDKSKPNWGIEPLPNLDFKLMQGNSLISEFMGINLDAEDSDAPAKLMKDETEELISRYQNKKSEFQYEPDRKKKEALKNEIDELIIRIFESRLKAQKADYHSGIQRIRQKYQDIPATPEYLEAKNKEIEALENRHGFHIEEAEKQLREFTTGLKVKPFFAWKLYFAEVFHEKGGFDIVIANPPYLGEKGHKEIFRQIKQGTLKEYYQGKMDIFYFFFHLAIDLGVPGAQIAFITTNYYPTATGANKLRGDFKKRTIIRELVNFNELKIFEAAQGQHNMLTILTKGEDDNSVVRTCITKHQGDATRQILQSILSWQDEQTDYYQVVQKDLYEGEECYIRLTGSSAQGKDLLHMVLAKLQVQGEPLKPNFCDINNGIHTEADYLSQRKFGQRNDKSASVGDGIYVLDSENENDNYWINQIEKSPKERKYLKPFYKNSDVGKYWTNTNTQKRVIYINKKDDNIDDLPHIKKHLYRFKRIIDASSDNSPYLHRPKNKTIFIQPKIVAPQRSYTNTFGYNEIPWYASADVYFITQKDKDVDLKYCLALLNSSLYYVWLYFKGKRKGEALELYQVPLSEIPIKKIGKIDQKPFISIVDKILSITKDEDYLSNLAKQAKVKELERQIDRMVYELYGLTEEEIGVVEGTLKK